MMELAGYKSVENDSKNKIKGHDRKNTTENNQYVGCILPTEKKSWNKDEIIGIIKYGKGQGQEKGPDEKIGADVCPTLVNKGQHEETQPD
jgi:hypothetical protein